MLGLVVERQTSEGYCLRVAVGQRRAETNLAGDTRDSFTQALGAVATLLGVPPDLRTLR